MASLVAGVARQRARHRNATFVQVTAYGPKLWLPRGCKDKPFPSMFATSWRGIRGESSREAERRGIEPVRERADPSSRL